MTSIGNLAFNNCTNLTGVTIPESVTNVMNYAFWGSTNLTGVFFAGDAPSVIGPGLFRDDSQVIIYYRPGSAGWTSTFSGVPTAPWPSISAQTTSDSQVLTWSQGVLLESTDMQTWTTNAAVSPYSVPIDAPQKFYQLRFY